MQPLRANSPWKMKDMRVEVKISTYPLLLDKHTESTMFPVMTASPLTLPPHAAWVSASHAANLYDVGYPSVALMMNTVLQLTFHCPPAQHTAEPHGFFSAATFQLHLYH